MLTIKGLEVNYGFVKAVKGVDISVNKGEIVSLIGANGAGKSTTLKAISGLVPANTGEILFEGTSIKNLNSAKIVSMGIIQCPEGRKIFPQLTTEENLKIGAYSRKDIKNIKEDFELIYTHFPRLKERRKQVAGTLSGGEQQMLAIGRGLMAKPKLFILDEPSLGLAPIIVKEIFEIINEINKQGVTILLVEQNAHQALRISNEVYVLETGKIKLSGKAEEIKNNDSIKKAYLGA
jgi:branched-chain amino acid transport system ATP-binding protein